MKPVKIFKKFSVFFLALCCTFITTLPAYAEEIQPMADSTSNANATLSISLDGQASCNVNITIRLASYRIEAVMSLNKIGQSTPLKSWSSSGTGRLLLSQNYYVSKGYDYQVTATITVKDSSGQLIESFSTTSAVVHY